MHSQETVSHALELHRAGLGARRIAKRLDIPLATVRDWCGGRVPRHSLPDDSTGLIRPLCDRCGSSVHDFVNLSPAYVYLLGLYLGDGCISSCHRGVFRFRIALDTRYPGIIRSAAAAITEIRGGVSHVQRQPGNWVEVSGYSKSWPCLFPQHAPGKKHDRPITLTAWQQELVGRWPDQLIRGLIQSDGCRFVNTGRGNWTWPRYSFTQKSDDIRGIFCDACDHMGLHWTQAGTRIYISRKADVARLDQFIGPKR